MYMLPLNTTDAIVGRCVVPPPISEVLKSLYSLDHVSVCAAAEKLIDSVATIPSNEVIFKTNSPSWLTLGGLLYAAHSTVTICGNVLVPCFVLAQKVRTSYSSVTAYIVNGLPLSKGKHFTASLSVSSHEAAFCRT